MWTNGTGMEVSTQNDLSAQAVKRASDKLRAHVAFQAAQGTMIDWSQRWGVAQ